MNIRFESEVMVEVIQQFTQKTLTATNLKRCLDQLDDLVFYCHLHQETVLHYIIKNVADPSNACFLIDAVLQRVKTNAALLSYLLTAENFYGLSPYYQALNQNAPLHTVAMHLAVWLRKAIEHGLMTPVTYARIHLNKNIWNQYPLYTLINDHHVLVVLLCLHEIEQARLRGWLSDHQIQSLFTDQDHVKVRLLDHAMQQGCHDWMEPIIRLIGIETLLREHRNRTSLHDLVEHANHRALHCCFTELYRAVSRKDIPTQTYPQLLFKALRIKDERVYYLLSMTFRPNHGQTSQVILLHAEIAHQHGWLNKDEYVRFLFNHPRKEEGFSYLHEAIRSGHPQNVYVYVSICLRAMMQDEITLEAFRDQVRLKNRHAYSTFSQAMNNDHLEIPELFINLYRVMFSAKEYSSVLFHSSGDSTVRCKKDKRHAAAINALLEHERVSGQRGFHSDVEGPIYSQDQGRQCPATLKNLCDLMQRVMDQQIQKNIQEIMQLLYSSAQNVEDVPTQSPSSQLIDAHEEPWSPVRPGFSPGRFFTNTPTVPLQNSPEAPTMSFPSSTYFS